AGRWHAGLPQDLGDARRRNANTDTGKLADDPLIAPPRILTRKPQHQLTNLLRDRRPARPPPRVRPPFPHKLAMPTKQRVRANEERRPARPAQQPASRGQEHPVGLLQPRPCDLPAQNRQLVTEHDDLKLLELTRTQPQRRHRERTPKQQIHQRDQHEAPSTKIANEKRDSTARRSGQQRACCQSRRVYVPDTQDEHERRSWTSVTELPSSARSGIRARVNYLNQRQRRPGAPNRHFETPQAGKRRAQLALILKRVLSPLIVARGNDAGRFCEIRSGS